MPLFFFNPREVRYSYKYNDRIRFESMHCRWPSKRKATPSFSPWLAEILKMPTWRFIILLWNWRLYWAFIMARSPFEKTTSKYAKWLRLSKNASGTPIRHVSMAVTYSRHMNLGLPLISNYDIGIQTSMLLINIFDILGWNFQSSVANQDYWQKMPRRADAGFFTCSLAQNRRVQKGTSLVTLASWIEDR